MKKYLFLSLMAIFALSSCSSFKTVGTLNMLSTRNIDSNAEYELKSSYTGGSKSELRKTKAETIEDAINETVRKVPGGEYLMNVKLYLVNGMYFAVEGDVWGLASNNSFKGFKVGDSVTWKNLGGNIYTGKIHTLKDDVKCIVQTEDGELIEKKYEDLSKTQTN